MFEITIKLPPLWTFAVVGLFCFVLIFAVDESGRAQRTASHLEDEQRTLRAIDHSCAQWKSDEDAFADCASEFRAYDRCELAWLRARDREDLRDSQVVCEHPVYRFHERWQAEIEQFLEGPVEQNRKQ